MNKLFSGLLFLFLIIFPNINANAYADSGIVIDGNLSDWNNRPSIHTKKYKASFINQGEKAYAYVSCKENLPSKYQISLNSHRSYLIVMKKEKIGKGKTKKIECWLKKNNKKISLKAVEHRNKRTKNENIEIEVPLGKLEKGVNQSTIVTFSSLNSFDLSITTGGVNTF
ncbi:MAG: hypothetical protein H9843_04225 [Candidatus Limosilactobacillus merdavium]|uniref:NEAT domain-containing protein n=1 Tax=Candidatus Limosilactobacillus merdavium TaxID=2838651 RepID=A0A9E2KVV8_9LACO|nr:hypothetical protein [Candidatus Limosilactobacillus merdavium]